MTIYLRALNLDSSWVEGDWFCSSEGGFKCDGGGDYIGGGNGYKGGHAADKKTLDSSWGSVRKIKRVRDEILESSILCVKGDSRAVRRNEDGSRRRGEMGVWGGVLSTKKYLVEWEGEKKKERGRKMWGK